MPASLHDAQLAADLADALYEFLPGKPHPFASTDLSFPGAAKAVGLRHPWSGGSKTPALIQLLTGTLRDDRQRFCPFLVAVVERAVAYRRNKGPLTREEIDRVNEVVARIGFKVPELHDRQFLDGLPRRVPDAHTPTEVAAEPATGDERKTPSTAERQQLADQLLALYSIPPAARGLAFEGWLNALFATYDLAPRVPFRLVGEQIDGSLLLDDVTYLLEAKWTAGKMGVAELLTFDGKVGGKARWARGLFVSFGGFTDVGLEAFARGRQTQLIAVDADDLLQVLGGAADLREVLKEKARRAAEENRAYVPVREFLVGRGPAGMPR